MSSNGRYELKFILDESKYTDVIRWLNTTVPSRRSYPGRFVNSVYFDDPEFTAVKDNLTGVSDRQKLRLRWYDSPGNPSSKPKLELKVREGRLGFKHHFTLDSFPEDIYSLLFTKFTEQIKENITDNTDACKIFSTHLSPSLYVNYYRDYFEAPFDLRITIDSKISYRLPDPFSCISKSISATYTHRIMEIKFPPPEKNNVSRLLNNLHLIPKRHSKYLMGLSMHGQVTYI